jgi:hypothetical protein
MTDDPITQILALRRRSLQWDWQLVTQGQQPLPLDACRVMSPGGVSVPLTTLLHAAIRDGDLDDLLAEHEGDAE